MEAQTERSSQLLTAKLYDAALKGDVLSLINLLQDDPLILDRCIIETSSQFLQSPLHVAANLGHLEFSAEILRLKPELAEELDRTRRWSPLHIASAKGYLEIVKNLLAVNPDMCFARDQDGRNPVHVAAVNGKVQVIDVLLQAKPQAGRERTNCGDTVLHLCVKHDRLESLRLLVLQSVGDDQLLNSKDSDGNTILHLAVAAKQHETVKFILKDKRVKKKVINNNGLTAMDTHIQSRKDAGDGGIERALRLAKVSTAKELLKPIKSSKDWIDKQRNALMVVSSLIATMAFQAGSNPPGGTWQPGSDSGCKIGTSIMACGQPSDDYLFGDHLFDAFMISNTVGLVSSLTVIILLISGLPCLRLFMGILMITMWVAVSATTVTYLLSLFFLTNVVIPDNEQISAPAPAPANAAVVNRHYLPVQRTIACVCLSWISLLGLLVLAHVIRLFAKLFKKMMHCMTQGYRRCYPIIRNGSQV